jgi:hypothetical protein
MQRYARVFKQRPGLVEGLPATESAIARAAACRESVHEIAQEHGIIELAVWNRLESLTRGISGQTPAHPTETASLGSDTDPDVTGGYGETSFGSLGNDPPIVTPEELQDRG